MNVKMLVIVTTKGRGAEPPITIKLEFHGKNIQDAEQRFDRWRKLTLQQGKTVVVEDYRISYKK